MSLDLDVLRGAQATGYGAVAALTCVAYDTLQNLDEEVGLVWRGPNTWINWAYAFIRYIPILHEMINLNLVNSRVNSPASCNRWITYQVVMMEIVTAALDVILSLRVYILYNEHRFILYSIYISLAAETTAMIATLVFVVPELTFDTSNCFITSSPEIFLIYWLSSLAFETYLFVLMLVNFFQNTKFVYGPCRIMYVFMRDGTWSYTLLFMTMLLNALMWRLIRTPLDGMGYAWTLSVMSFTGSHLVLNIRRLGRYTEYNVSSLLADFGDRSEETSSSCRTSASQQSFA